MQDNALLTLIISTIIASEAIAGIPGTPIAQAFQPTKQGVNTGPTAYLHKVGDRRYGSPLRSDFWDKTNSTMVHLEAQRIETTLQMSALSTQDPNTPNQLTASDLLNLIAYTLQCDTAIAAFQAQEVGILRVMDVRNPYFTDDRGQFAASPNFDFVMEHKQVIKSTSPVVEETIFQILTV